MEYGQHYGTTGWAAVYDTDIPYHSDGSNPSYSAFDPVPCLCAWDGSERWFPVLCGHLESEQADGLSLSLSAIPSL